jgi:hypothetical protein
MLARDVLRAVNPAFDLAPLTMERIRALAPGIVTLPETFNYRLCAPQPGGLFDPELFGPGSVPNAAPIADEAPEEPGRTRFARIPLVRPMPHPLLGPDHTDALLHDILVLPPDLRPLRAKGERWETIGRVGITSRFPDACIERAPCCRRWASRSTVKR